MLISTLDDRFKARDIRRTSWASMCVMGHEPPCPSAMFSGPAEILTGNIGPPSDQALAEAGRVILAIDVDRVTAANYIPGATRQSQS